jgi:hypothetical protein
VPHAFRNATGSRARLLFFHQPTGLEEFFEEWGIPVSQVGEVPAGLEPPDLAAMGAALERNGVHFVGDPQPVA